MTLQVHTLPLHWALTSNRWAGFCLSVPTCYYCYWFLLPCITFLCANEGGTNALSSSAKNTVLLMLHVIKTQVPTSTHRDRGLRIVYAVQTGFKHWKQLLLVCTWNICRMTPESPSKKVTCPRVETLRLIGWIIRWDAESWLRNSPFRLEILCQCVLWDFWQPAV